MRGPVMLAIAAGNCPEQYPGHLLAMYLSFYDLLFPNVYFHPLSLMSVTSDFSCPNKNGLPVLVCGSPVHVYTVLSALCLCWKQGLVRFGILLPMEE